jgi:carbonic anhydrase
MGYYAFKGSLTTPPCSEGVAWQVLKTPVEISKAQIQAFKKIFKMNARPVQPLNQRKVQEAN